MDASRAVDQPELIDGWTDSKRPGRFGWLFASIWLAYLGPTLQSAWEIDQPVRRVAAVATVLVFAAGYAHTFYVARHSRWMGERLHNLSSSERIIRLSLAIGLTVLGCSLIGQSGLAFTVYLVVTAIIMLPLRAGIAFVAATMVAVEIATRTIPGWKVDNGLLFSLFVSALAIWGITQMVARNVQLAGARAEIAALAVAQERSRFARDLHDLLGHSLTVVTVKAELAGRLIAIDPDRAEKEIADVERLARDALADVRAAVSGYREVTLATELVSARTALEAAGIIAELPGAVDDVPGDRRELFGWAVREGTTNVVRHSDARHCWIVLGATAVEILDDGTGPAADCSGAADRADRPRMGTGLVGLRERADAVGASVTVGRVSDAGGFRLRVGW